MNILHEGNVSFEKKIGDSSIPLYILPGPNITLGAAALLEGGNYFYTVRAKSTCIISTYSMNPATVQKTLLAKVSLAMMVAKTTLREVGELFKKNNQVVKLASVVESFADNLSLTYYLCNPGVFPNIDINKPISTEEYIIDPILRMVK